MFFLLAAGWLTYGLWLDPTTRTLALNPQDQILIEWFMANDTRILLGDFTLVSDRLNAPDGFNMMTNATMIVPGLLLTPVTLLFGAATTFAVLIAGNLAATSIGWYFLYTRTLRAHRVSAVVGAAFCGFAPGMISQSNSHPHMTAQWLVPALVWCVVRMAQLADPARPEGGPPANRRLLGLAALLAALVCTQVFVGEEVLFLTAGALALMTVGYAVAAPRHVRRVLPRFSAALLVSAALAAVVLAYPLWVQFYGRQSIPNGIFSPDYFSADLASYPAISPLSLFGSAEAARLSTGAAEYNSFLGLPLLVVAVALAWWLRRRPLVIPLVVTGLICAWLSLGPRVVLDGTRTETWAPYSLLRDKPIIEGALPMRFALVLIPVIATLLVLALDRARTSTLGATRIAVPVAVAAALIPIAPAQLPTADRAPVPTFITAGHWRDCAPADGVLVPVPLPTPQKPEKMRWAAAANAEFRLPEGFFIAPYAAGGKASMGTYKQPTSALLSEVAESGAVPGITDANRQQATRDVAFWDASCLVLAQSEPNAAALRQTLEALYGPATTSADVWTWRF
ncbi:hypothetical protein I0C86_33140 [Plantactinospora sp. S1510]|uniref:Glycosyl transferase n=1 Tax=Plantactinospora alkalitolerans TaxID=2789879 RepID=A0ABS0H5J9_9ACTN|nr:hypothetical protein [Plantactinospora alkalitolerans]